LLRQLAALGEQALNAMTNAVADNVSLAERKVAAKRVFEFIEGGGDLQEVDVCAKIFKPQCDIKLDSWVSESEAGSFVIGLAREAKWADLPRDLLVTVLLQGFRFAPVVRDDFTLKYLGPMIMIFDRVVRSKSVDEAIERGESSVAAGMALEDPFSVRERCEWS
jgi:hypothetical protein